jgi:hypothetical protein
LTLTVTTSTQVPVTADLDLRGTSATGEVRSMAVQADIDPFGDPTARTTTTIVFDETNSDIVAFLNNLPVEVTATGTVTAGDSAVSGTVRRDDYVRLDWRIAAPAEIVVTGAVITTDPRALAVDDDLREKIRSHAGAARLETVVANHFPIGATLRVFADTCAIGDDPLLVIGPLTVVGGSVDPETHTCIAARESRPTIDLDPEETRIFGYDNLRTRIEVNLPATAGEAVRVLGDDYLTVNGVIRVEVMVDDDW